MEKLGETTTNKKPFQTLQERKQITWDLWREGSTVREIQRITGYGESSIYRYLEPERIEQKGYRRTDSLHDNIAYKLFLPPDLHSSLQTVAFRKKISLSNLIVTTLNEIYGPVEVRQGLEKSDKKV